MSVEIGLGPQRVQIQTQSGCDGRCVFCPNADVLKSDLPQGRMAPELYHKIIGDLARTPPHRVSTYLMNEPLLDQRLPDLIRHTSQALPGVTTLVTSNGTHLTHEMGEALIGAGLKRLKVSLQSLDRETNAKLMGASVDSEQVVENVLAFKRLLRAKRSKLDLRMSMVVTTLNAAEIDRARRFWRKHGIRLVTSALENRGGNIANADALNPHGMACFHCDCIRPSREMCVLWNGDVVLCCVDWWRTEVVGNVAEQSVQEIWQGARLREVRTALRENDERTLPKICANCAESAQPDYHRGGLRGFLSRRFGTAAKPKGDASHD
ncbi:MAG: radical SAM protein [Nitrospiraceae bacterium]|nr:radical SAM protein [Nitrospiraceae bacterium]